MLFTRSDIPKENEILLCKVTKVLPNSVFANLEEYSKTGMLHISEVSPGRIRNIRDYVVEGKVIICKVLHIDKERGHIDLSLRRVSESQRRNKIDELKKEQIAEKIVEFLAKKHNKDVKIFYKEVTKKVFEEYSSLYSFFEEIVEGNVEIGNYGIDPAYVKEFEELIRQRIKLPEYTIKGELILTSKEPNGVEIVMEALKKASEVKEDHTIKYNGAGKYSVSVTSEDPKEAETIIKDIKDRAIKYMKSHNSEGDFVRAG